MRDVGDESVIVVNQNLTILSDDMLTEWAGTPFAQLSVILVNLRFLAFVHQTHHWSSAGDSFYGDHLLFDRLYSKVVEEVDLIGEKSVGLGTPTNVDLPLQVAQLARLVSTYGRSNTIPQHDELAMRSLTAETNFLQAVDSMVISLKETHVMSRGLDNLIAGIEDTHESHVYLLKQRMST